MRTTLLSLVLMLSLFGCKQEKEEVPGYNEALLIEQQQEHENPRMRYKLIASRVERPDMFAPFEKALDKFGEERYTEMMPLVLERSIPEIQESVAAEEFTYEELCLFYLWRIRKYEQNPETSLHTIISLNPQILEQAAAMDRLRQQQENKHPIFGMPVLLKDNIGAEGMPTTAGAVVLQDNMAGDAFITKQLKSKGALILGKANLSEWAYYFCQGCPVGYSAIGGQTLNPYGPREFETGGSSSGSGVAIAANYAVGAVGSETSGSILSPSGQNSVVGLKPTIGVLGRTGIVPISSTLDTPGPMTKNVTDNVILMDAMSGEDPDDAASLGGTADYLAALSGTELQGKRLGVYQPYMESDSLYAQAVEALRKAGAEILVYEEQEGGRMQGFTTLLNMDMKYDLPAYLEEHSSKNITVREVADIAQFNLQDTLVRMPYGQKYFQDIIADTTSSTALEAIKETLRVEGQKRFDMALKIDNVDAFLSINNYSAGYAAVAKYPALCVPMGYTPSGEPEGITLIGLPYSEKELLELGMAIETVLKARKQPEIYK
ncbi:amidase [Robertkochia marina]|uniref:Amidase n=1 Tax=Robertkochia marina TaxID=1227945 RepID=A0A4S3LWZ7_9FLAO|nr:amidase family protein [Robertkochia marina]THD65704.1 amidase [Robertkochia marina]TRZ46612.1 amidase [Robertkochia marina]